MVLCGSINNVAQTIQIESIGTIDTDSRKYHGYSMVEFSSSPYTLQENKTIDDKVIESGELVSNGRYFNTAIAHSIRYVNKRYGNIETIISLGTILKSDISVRKIKFIKYELHVSKLSNGKNYHCESHLICN